tara:strand:+ start:2332 stop:4179 length:1848 start_codon:yes stop_codon:yes gene_type:complete
MDVFSLIASTKIDIYLALLVFIGLTLVLVLSILKRKRIGTSDADIKDWSITNSIKLYKTLRYQGIGLELAIIGMGCYTALTYEKGLALTIIYTLVVSVSEISKLAVTESLFRYPRFSLICLALPALAISITFTNESLLRVTSKISTETNNDIAILVDEIKDNDEKKANAANEILDLEYQKENIRKKIDESEVSKLNQIDLAEMKEKVIFFQKVKENAIDDNNLLEKQNLQRLILSLNNSLQSIDKVIIEIKNAHQSSLEALRNLMLKEVENTPFYSKGKIREYYDSELSGIKDSHVIEINSYKQEAEEIKIQIKKANIEFEKLIPLSSETQDSIAEIENKINEINLKIESLTVGKNNFVKDLSLKNDNLENRINIQKSEVLRLNESNSDITSNINSIKTDNVFYSIASIFYNKSASDLSEEEVSKFLMYFIGISALGLSLMPVLLFGISVLIEKSLRENADRVTFRQYVINVLGILKEICSHLSSSTSSMLNIAREKRQRRIEENNENRQLKRDLAYKEAELDHLEKVSNHKAINKEVDVIKSDRKADMKAFSQMKSLINEFMGNFEEIVMKKLGPKIEKNIIDEVDKKELSTKITKNYISEDFVKKLVEGGNKL